MIIINTSVLLHGENQVDHVIQKKKITEIIKRKEF